MHRCLLLVLLFGLSVFGLSGASWAESAPEAASDPTPATELNEISEPQTPSTAPSLIQPRINPDEKTAPGANVVSADPLKVIGGLLVVVGSIFAIGWLFRRATGGAVFAGQGLKVVAALSVGTREKVVLVDVGGQQILLGVAPGRVSHLQSFDQPVLDLQTTAAGDFSSVMKKIMPRQADSAMADKR